MNQLTRDGIWEIVKVAFDRLIVAVSERVPNARVDCAQNSTDAFPFWAYAQFSLGANVVVVSFVVQARGSEMKVVGDVAREDGYILREILSVVRLSAVPVEPRFLLACANEFALTCTAESEIVISDLLRVPIQGQMSQ